MAMPVAVEVSSPDREVLHRGSVNDYLGRGAVGRRRVGGSGEAEGDRLEEAQCPECVGGQRPAALLEEDGIVLNDLGVSLVDGLLGRHTR